MIVVKGRPLQRSASDPERLVARRTTRLAMALSLVSGLALWASFPPLNLWPLAWIAPVPWLLLTRIPRRFTGGTYLAVWLGALVHWLAMLQGIRLAHPALVFGWLVLAAYVACYIPLLVWLGRVAVRKMNIPLVFAAPVIWVGLELIRGYFVTGFSAGLLGHTQTAWTSLLQVADVFGAYGVSFLLMLAAAAFAQMIPLAWLGAERHVANRWPWWPALPAAATIAAALAYGHYRLAETPPRADERPLRAALIQGSLDTVFDRSEAEYQRRVERTFQHYDELTAKAIAQPGQLDLVVWPESMFASVESRIQEPLEVPSGVDISPAELRRQIGELSRRFQRVVRDAAASLNATPPRGTAAEEGTCFLFGTTTFEYGPPAPKRYNAALLADPQGRIVGRYYKIHLVMFGEYIPLGEWFPWIYRVTPLGDGLDRGAGPAVMNVGGKRLAPSICFENVVPHLIRQQVIELSEQGKPPDILVTITNDGWFHGSAILDLHLRCAVFRAIENRRPMLIAANTGFSAHIDGSGRVLALGPRRAPAVLSVEAKPDGRVPLYHTLGDWPAMVCAAACGVLGACGLWRGKTPTPSIPLQ